MVKKPVKSKIYSKEIERFIAEVIKFKEREKRCKQVEGKWNK